MKSHSLETECLKQCRKIAGLTTTVKSQAREIDELK